MSGANWACAKAPNPGLKWTRVTGVHTGALRKQKKRWTRRGGCCLIKACWVMAAGQCACAPITAHLSGCRDTIIHTHPDLSKLNKSRKKEKVRVYFCHLRTLSAFFPPALSADHVSCAQSSAFQAASPIPGTGQLPAEPSSHIIDLHQDRVSPDIGVREGWGGQLVGWVQLCRVMERMPDLSDGSLLLSRLT